MVGQRWSASCRLICDMNCINITIRVYFGTVILPRPQSRNISGFMV